MARKFLTPIDLNQNQLLNAALQNLGSAPSTPVAGQAYWSTASNRPYFWNPNDTAFENYATNSDALQGQVGTYYLNRANHTGTQLAATISNFAAAAQALTLDTFSAPVALVNFNSQRLTNLATPLSPNDAANKSYVDSTAQGLSAKPTARAATTAALPANTYANGTAGVGATLTATSNGVLTVDGYTPALNDILLIKNEATQANNGEYTVTQLGSSSVPYILMRHIDMDQATEFGGGFIPVENVGTTNANSLWLCNVANSITVGTTAVVFTQLNSSTALAGSTSVSVSGNVASVIVASGGGILVGASGLYTDATVGVRKYATSVGDGSTLSYTITHGLGTGGAANGQDVTVSVYSATTPFAEVDCDINHATVNTLTLGFAVAPTTNQYRVVVHG